jgi:hypothetical protein
LFAPVAVMVVSSVSSAAFAVRLMPGTIPANVLSTIANARNQLNAFRSSFLICVIDSHSFSLVLAYSFFLLHNCFENIKTA